MAVRVAGYRGIAWNVLGAEEVEDEDTYWTGYTSQTGKLRCVMVGDDRVFSFDPEDIEDIEDHEYCPGCGQIGCNAYGVEE